MVAEQPSQIFQTGTRKKFFYGWVIVAACALLIGFTYGLMYSYSVFFKPLAEYFNWDRATVSFIYSASMFIRGAISIGTGWLADKYGARKLMIFCGFMIALGLILSSQVHSLWQFILTYAVIEAIGFSGAFGIATAVISRWFTKNRGLALGIVSAGSGLGVVFIVPGNERLISAVGWSEAFIVCGVIAGVVIILAAFLLRPAPKLPDNVNPASIEKLKNPAPSPSTDITLKQAIKNPSMILLMCSYFLFFFGVQLIMVHLVNYSTDVGISPLVAATFISIIGAFSILSRLATGIGSDKIGIHSSFILTSIFLVVAFIILSFTKSLWMFYLFAVIFSMPYGGEIPLLPLYIGKYFGTKSMATLVGLNGFVTNIGGALGPWVAGRIFDSTHSYQSAFIVGGMAGLGSLICILFLKRRDRRQSEVQRI